MYTEAPAFRSVPRETRVHNALDDVADNMCQTLTQGLQYTVNQFFETGEPVGYTIELSSRPTANVTMTLAPRISTNENLFPSSGVATECRASPFWCRTAAIKVGESLRTSTQLTLKLILLLRADVCAFILTLVMIRSRSSACSQ